MKDEGKDIFSVLGRLPCYSKLLLKLYKSPQIRKRHKLILSAGIAYSVSPIDLIPGIIPVAGQLDNLLVMLRCLLKVIETADPKIIDKYLGEAGITLKDIKEDSQITSDTLKSIGRGTFRVLSNTGKTLHNLTLLGIRKLIRKDPY